MISNTHCKNCIFAKPANSNISCEFEIPSCIEPTHEVIIKDDYWYLKNYKCRFALSQNFFDTTIKKIVEEQNIDIKEYVVFRNTIRYYLVINFHDTSYTVKQLCDKLIRLQIPPKFVSIMFYMRDKQYMFDTVNTFKDIIGDTIAYKIHNFIEPISKDEALFTVLETTLKKNNSDYLWILNNNSLDYSVDDESIGKINYQINVLQPSCNLLKSKISNDNFDTLFLNFDNYSGITKNINQSLSAGIEAMPNVVINNYD